MSSAQKKSSSAGPTALIMKIGAKAGPVAFKLFKLIKLGKLSMAALSVGSYALIFTWQFALVITGMLVLHEYGHLLMMKRYRMRTKGMYLIPFVGAAAVAEEDFPTRKAETEIAIAGPLVGGALALLCGILYLGTRNPYLAAVAGWMAMVNLFNLIPITPLDGGRVLKSITFSIGTKLGLAFMVLAMIVAVLLAVRESLVIFVVLIPVGVIEFLFERRRARKTYRMPAKPVMSKRAVRFALGGYIALAASLWGFMLLMSHEPGAQEAMRILQG